MTAAGPRFKDWRNIPRLRMTASEYCPDLPERLRTMVDKAVENMENSNQLSPVAFFAFTIPGEEWKGDQIAFIGLDFVNDDAKDAIADALRSFAVRHDCHAYMMLTEAWAVDLRIENDPEEVKLLTKGMLRPSQSKYRVEVFMVNGEVRRDSGDVVRFQYYFPFERNGDGRLDMREPTRWSSEDGVTAEGRFTGILRPKT